MRVDLGSARLTQHGGSVRAGFAADDRVVDDDEPFAPDHLAQRVELEADAQLADGSGDGWMNVRPT